MRNRIWSEITQTKHQIEYLRLYSRLQARLQRLFNILILVFSGSGILGWGIWKEPFFAGVACILTASISLLKLISPQFLLSPKDSRKLDEYYLGLGNHFNSLERFWYESESDSISGMKPSDTFYSLVESANKLHHEYSELDIIHYKRLIKKADNYSNSYLSSNF